MEETGEPYIRGFSASSLEEKGESGAWIDDGDGYTFVPIGELEQRLAGSRSVAICQDSSCESICDYIKAVADVKGVVCLWLRGDIYGLSLLGYTCPADPMLKALSYNSTITSLLIPDTAVTAVGISHISTMSSIEYLGANRTTFDDECAKEIAGNARIRELRVDKCDIGPLGATYISNMRELEHLDITDNDIRGEGATALLGNTRIIHLKMSRCNIDDSIPADVVSNTTVCKIWMRSNKVGDSFASAIAHNSSVMKLDVSRCKIEEDGGIEMLKNTTMTNLTCEDNPMPKHLWETLELIGMRNKRKCRVERKRNAVLMAFLFAARCNKHLKRKTICS